MADKLTAAQRNARREIGKLERRIARTAKTQVARKDRVAKLRKKA